MAVRITGTPYRGRKQLEGVGTRPDDARHQGEAEHPQEEVAELAVLRRSVGS